MKYLLPLKKLFQIMFLVGWTVVVSVSTGVVLGRNAEGQGYAFAIPDSMPLLDAFKMRYDEVMQEVKDGTIPGNIGSESEAIWISLQKILIQYNAKMETYKLETREYRGTKQEKALANLVRVTAERERILMEYIQRLEKLYKGKRIGIQPSQDQVEKFLPMEEKKNSEKVKKKTSNIEIEFKADDIIKNGDPME
jgi:hypothetical protein